MKKIYTLLLAAAVGVSAASAAVDKAAVTSARMSAQKMELNTNTEAVMAKATAHKMAKLPAKAEAKAADIAGKYFITGMMSSGQYSMLDMLISGTEGNYTMSLPEIESNNVPVTFGDKTFDIQGQSYTIPCLSIRGNGQETLFTEEGLDYKIYLTGIGSNGNASIFTDDTIDFIYEDGVFYPLWNNTGFGWYALKESQYWGNGLFADVSIHPSNATMYTTLTSSSGSNDLDFPVSVAQNGSELSMFNFGALMSDIKLTYDHAEKLVVASNQILDAFEQDGKNYEIILGTVMDGKLYAAAIFEVEEENGKTYLVNAGEMGAYVFEGGAENGTLQGYMYKYANTEIALDWSISEAYTAGVNEIISAEAVDTNAPVEYYNLQGVRVAEPAAGLYIKRQGKTVTKVVIR